MTSDPERRAAGSLPLIDFDEYRFGRSRAETARELGEACRTSGFFYARGFGVDPEKVRRLQDMARRFFALPLEEKLALRMELHGRAWRGYFPVGRELTSGRPDRKEGFYFGADLAPDHPLVRSRTPLHGANVYPEIPGMRAAVLEYLDAMRGVSRILLRALAESLGLAETYFDERYPEEPFVLFRLFHYPASEPGEASADDWGVREHTDYGWLTLLAQDEEAGLEVRVNGEWIEAPPVPGTFVCNLGDMLERMTGGHYLSTPHRVRTPRERGRLSMPFFYDPAFESRVEPIEFEGRPRRAERWDGRDPADFEGTYGDYLSAKVRRVFPHLWESPDASGGSSTG